MQADIEIQSAAKLPTRHVRRSLWHDASIFRQVTAQSVDQLGPLLHEKIARPEDNGPGLLLLILHGHVPHVGPLGRLADRLRISRIILMPLDERFDIRRRDQADRVTQLGDLAGPVMGPAARLQGHQARRLRGHELDQFRAGDLLAKDDMTRRIRSMRLENVLSDVQSDCAHLTHRRLLQRVFDTHSATARPSGASTPSHAVAARGGCITCGRRSGRLHHDPACGG